MLDLEVTKCDLKRAAPFAAIEVNDFRWNHAIAYEPVAICDRLAE
jgi:hypothetical protein